MSGSVPWAISGTYLEACNCDAICPCRTVGGRKGGRSTYGTCMGALSWRIAEGEAGDIPLSRLNVVLALRYEDDEPGSPWDFFLYLDDRGDERQLEALEAIFLGQLGGTPLEQFPWAFKPSHLLAVVPCRIEIDHTPGKGWFRAGSSVSVRIAAPYDTQSPVTCVIPGHDRTGREVVADRVDVHDDHHEFGFSGRCGYEATFEYASS